MYMPIISAHSSYMPPMTVRLAIIVSFFNCKNALQEKNAMVMSSTDWISIGIDKNSIHKFSFVKSTADGKYWIDEKELQEYSSKSYKYIHNVAPIMALATVAVMSALFLFFMFYVLPLILR